MGTCFSNRRRIRNHWYEVSFTIQCKMMQDSPLDFVTSFKQVPIPAHNNKLKVVRVMVNVHGQKQKKGDTSRVDYTVEFKTPELRCSSPEYVVLGKLEPGEPLRMDRPVCYRVHIVQGNKRGRGIMLKAAFTGSAISLRPLQLFTSQAGKNQWTPVKGEPSQNPQHRSFYMPTSEVSSSQSQHGTHWPWQNVKEVDVFVMSTSNQESQYMV